TQRAAQSLVIFDQRTGQTMTNRACLTETATTGNSYFNIELVTQTNQLKRLTHDHTCGRTTKVNIQRTIIDGNLTTACFQKDTGRGGFTTPGTRILRSGHSNLSLDVDRKSVVQRWTVVID